MRDKYSSSTLLFDNTGSSSSKQLRRKVVLLKLSSGKKLKAGVVSWVSSQYNIAYCLFSNTTHWWCDSDSPVLKSCPQKSWGPHPDKRITIKNPLAAQLRHVMQISSINLPCHLWGLVLVHLFWLMYLKSRAEKNPKSNLANLSHIYSLYFSSFTAREAWELSIWTWWEKGNISSWSHSFQSYVDFLRQIFGGFEQEQNKSHS